ncbi:MAG: PIN/TRAM domain-containing protein, partial [Acidimicrobiales bacterium]
ALPVGFVLPVDVGWPIFALVVWVAAYFGASIGASKADTLLGLAGLSTRPLIRATPYSEGHQTDARLLDTSAIIDGRILGLVRSGLLEGDLLVPCFVLDELGGIADGSDPVRRRRGRRGLDLLAYLKTCPGVEVHVLDDEVPEHVEVDAKLIALARRIGCGIVTVDRPLQKVAELRGVTCLNPEALSEVLRDAYVPGETMNLDIVRPGREVGQGVGFLPDGTMVVVGDAAGLIGSQVEVRVTGNLQTSVGLLLFANLAGGE